MTGFWILAGLIVLLVLLVIGIYNRLVSLRQNCRQALADIDAQLTQRSDLIPNLVETVKGYAAHETGTLDAVIAARAKAANGSAEGESALDGALRGLFALAESYPDLKANTNFQSLQHELADVEDKLAAARRALNSAAADFNSARESFPAVLFAARLGFAPADFSTIAAADRARVTAVPGIKF